MIAINKVTRARMARLLVLSLMLATAMWFFVPRYSLPVYAHGESIQASPSEAKPGA